MGELTGFDLSESGRKIGEKLFALLNEEQRKDLCQYVLEIKTFRLLPTVTTQENDLIHRSLTELKEGDLYLCVEQRLVRVQDQEIELTAKEFDILALLMMNPRRVFTYEMIMDIVWHEEFDYYSRKAVNNHVSNLRRKLKIRPDLPDYIKSVHCVGYKFDILDEDRKINAQKFESAFYANPDLRNVKPPQEQPPAQTVDLAALIEQLQKSPELASTLAALISGQKAVFEISVRAAE